MSSHFKIKDYSLRIATVWRMLATGKSTRDVAELVGMTPKHVRRIITEREREMDREFDIANSPNVIQFELPGSGWRQDPADEF
jgi:hypothetical protein